MSSELRSQGVSLAREVILSSASSRPNKYRRIDPGQIDEGTTRKLSNEEIYEKIRNAICFINDDSTAMSKTGFFLKNGRQIYVITAAADLPDNPERITMYRKEGRYELKNPENLTEPEDYKRVNLRLFECYGKIASELDFLEMVPKEIDIRIGRKIHFAGFPLQETAVTFHKGMISSVKIVNQVTSYTLDATVVKGCSGSPVVIQENGRLYVIGVITSQVIDSQTSHEVDEPNLSTGIGRAVDIKHIYECLKQDDLDPEEVFDLEEMIGKIKGPSFDEPVGKPRVVKGRIVRDILRQYGYIQQPEDGPHETWSKQDCHSVSVSRGSKIKKYTAEGIMKIVAEDNNLNSQELKSSLR